MVRPRRMWPLLSVAILLASLAVWASAALLWRARVRSYERQRFEADAADVTATLASGLRRDTDFMETLRALVAMRPRMTATQLGRWYAELDGRRREVGGLLTAVVSLVPAGELPAFQARRMADPVFRRLSGGGGAIVPPGRRPRYCLLSAIVSRLPESSLIQLATHADWCASTIAGTARVLRAETDSGALSVSPPVLGTPFLGTPAYRVGAPLHTVRERRAAVAGWIWSSVDIPAAIRASIGAHRDFAVTVYHHDPLYGDQLIGGAGTAGSSGVLTRSARLDMDGGWIVRVQGAPSASGLPADVQGAVVFAVGAAMSVLLAALASVLMRSRERALGLADERTGQLLHMALHDPMTGLPNRVLALDRAEQMLASARRRHAPIAALHIDLDGFKHVNDTFGHAAGDALLREVAARLSKIVRETDTAARLGADEFVVLVDGSSLQAGPELVAERLLEVLRLPYEVRGSDARPLSVTASIGIAHGMRESAEELLRDASVALHEAKASGRNRYVLFESSMHVAATDRMTLEMDLADALERDELVLLYQPTFDLRSERPIGVEALLRWRHPTRGMLTPEEFVPIAEESGLIVPIGRWVLRRACRQACAWRRQGHPIGVSVNVSARQLDGEALLAEVRHALRDSGLEPGALTLEVTETTIMRDAEATARRLGLLKQLGVRIAIDDFGTGYSSLAYLRQFPVDALKIDRSFVAGVARSKEAAALVHTLVQLGKTLELDTVAEGIEDGDQLRALQREGCDHGQGFLFARPLDAEAIERLLDGASRRAPEPAA